VIHLSLRKFILNVLEGHHSWTISKICHPVVDKYKDMGTIALGKVESGQVYLGQRLILMPNKVTISSFFHLPFAFLVISVPRLYSYYNVVHYLLHPI